MSAASAASATVSVSAGVTNPCVTTKHYYVDNIKESDPPALTKCQVSVVTGDMFRVAAQERRPVLHNFANNRYQGGPASIYDKVGNFIAHRGGNTQEDQIVKKYRSKLLFPAKYYPICDDKGEALLYSHCDDLAPVITLAAPIDPNFASSDVRKSIIRRIHLMLKLSADNDNTLITGLWGCGAFGANPRRMAELWGEALATAPYKPRKVVFCILLDQYSNKWGKAEDILSYFRDLNNPTGK